MTPSEIQKVKDDLLDARTLAESIYDFWISLMITDQVPGIDGVNWKTISDDAREDFIEAIKLKVSDRVLSLEFANIDAGFKHHDVPSHIDEGPPMKKVCYICAAVVIEVPQSRVAICPDCKVGVIND